MNRFVAKLRHYHSAVGWKGVVAFCWAKLICRQSLFAVRLPDLKFPIDVRLATTDVSVLKQVLIEKHYAFSLSFSPRTIVDAGANIGLSAVYFANRFPEARILALEPESSNFELLVKNTAPYANIEPINAALWHSEGSISLVDPGLGNHGYQTHDSPANPVGCTGLVKSTTVDALMRGAGWTTIDLLKLDIEGAEKEVFDASITWINKVRAIMAELHETSRPGCNASFAGASRGFREGGRCGESLMVWREPFQSIE